MLLYLLFITGNVALIWITIVWILEILYEIEVYNVLLTFLHFNVLYII